MVDSSVLPINGTKEQVKDPKEGFLREKNTIIPKQASSPVKVYTSNIGRKRAPSLRWESPEWDLAECGRIIDTEALVRRAFAVKEALFTKEGYDFIGSKPERVAYVRKRLQQMEHAGGVPFPILMSGTVNSLVRMQNAFWAKKRDKKASGGGPRTNANGKKLDPVAAYFPIPAETVRFKRDEYGRVTKYQQVVYGKEPVDFAPEDVIHFYFDKREGFSVGTPILAPVKDDIRALRRIEENIELLVYSHLFPLYHYQVGTESAPAMVFPDGSSEVEVVQQEVANMPSDGCWVTPERHNITVVGANGEALNTDNILSHFKQRIYIGLGVSSVDMGEGGTANRSTAQTMSRNLIDRTKAEQRILESFINKYVIEELLLESSFPQSDIFAEENLVRLSFKEIDNEAKQALENHATQMYVQNGFTHDEMREYIGKEPFTEEDWSKSYWQQIDEPTKLMQSLDEPYCQSKDTEILTESGWKLFKDLTEEDNVATLREGHILVYEKPIERLEFDYKGKMYLLQSRFIDTCVTPNHKLYVSLNEGKNTCYNLVRADECFGKYKKFKRSVDWCGSWIDVEEWTLPEATIKVNQCSDKTIPSVSYKTEDWVEFLGWYLSEGYADKNIKSGYKIGISQDLDIHPEHCERIEDLLIRMDLPYRYESNKQFIFNDVRIYKYIENNCPGGAKDKKIPHDIKQLHPRYLKILLNSMMAGDGEEIYHYLYSTISKQLADDIQEIALKVGYSANIRIETREDHNDIYRVGINRDKYCDVADRMRYGGKAKSLVEEWIDYNDKVYSVRTESGVIYVRRNGKARWCGNSAEAKAVARANTTSIEEPDLKAAQSQKEKERKEELAVKKQSAKKPQALPTRKTNKTSENRNKPRNQHGTRSSAKLNKDFKDAYTTNPSIPSLDAIFSQRAPIAYVFDTLKTDIIRSIKSRGFEEDVIQTIIGSGFEHGKDLLIRHAKRAYRTGITDAGTNYWDIRLSKIDAKIEKHVKYYVDKLRDEVIKNIKRQVVGTKELGAEDALSASLVMDSLAHRSRMIDESEVMRAYNAGRADAYKFQGVQLIKIERQGSSSCESCNRSTLQWTATDAIIYEDLPPLHPHCRCILKADR